MICKFCGYGLLSAYHGSVNPNHCPVCGGGFYRRTVDNAETIKVRLTQYAERTKPIFGLLKKAGVSQFKIDAKPAPYKVFEKISKHLK